MQKGAVPILESSNLTRTWELSSETPPDSLYVEGIKAKSADKEIELKLTLNYEGQTSSDTVKFTIAPYLLIDNTRAAEKIYVSNSDTAFVEALDNVDGSPNGAIDGVPIVIVTGGTQWIQDAIEIGYSRWPEVSQMHMIWDLPKVNLEDWAKNNLLMPGFGMFEEGSVDVGGNRGGNIEVSPPVPNHRLGRAVIGSNSSVTGFIDNQGIQTHIDCDTSWLVVGHIDEVITFVPYGGSFKVLVADTDLAISLLEQLNVTDTGTASIADVGSITDTSKAWTANKWIGGFIEITAGSGIGQVRQVAGNTSNIITVSRPWTTVPDNSSQYMLVARSAYRAMFFEGDEDCGVASEQHSSALMLVDSTKNWPTHHWDNGYVLIVEGPGAGEVSQISLSDADSILVSPAFTVKPTEQSRYVLVQSSKMWNEQTVLQPEAIITVRQVLQGQLGILDISEGVSDEINSIRIALKNGLGLSDNDFVEIPALFWDGDQYISGDQIVANIPGMVNMLVVGNRAIIAKPFGPLDNGTNIFEDYVESELGSIGISVNFVDDWDTYHRNDGEIHCGTNVKRTPHNTNWWEH